MLLISTSALCAPPQLAELTASDRTSNDQFGEAVAMSGSTVVVGAPGATIGSNPVEGAAYVFVKPANGWGNMTQVAKLTPSDGSHYQNFGYSVAVSGNTIVVGSIGCDPACGAYVFVKPLSGWKDMTETAKLNVGYALAVAVSGNTVVVGSPAGLGAAVFLKPKQGWVSTSQPSAVLTASDGVTGDEFGVSIAFSSDTVVVGADASGTTGLGAAYVFVKPTSGWTNMTQTAKLTPSNGVDADYFGISVAINVSTIVVGAPNPFWSGTPAAYIYVQPFGGWANTTETARLEWAYDGNQSASFADSVALSGSRIVVGDPYGPPAHNGQGEALVFTKPKTGWQTTFRFNAVLSASDDTNVSDTFGIVAMSGARIVIGASKLPLEPGAAYVF